MLYYLENKPPVNIPRHQFLKKPFSVPTLRLTYIRPGVSTCKAYRNATVSNTTLEGWRDCGKERWLLFQRIRVPFPATAWQLTTVHSSNFRDPQTHARRQSTTAREIQDQKPPRQTALMRSASDNRWGNQHTPHDDFHTNKSPMSARAAPEGKTGNGAVYLWGVRVLIKRFCDDSLERGSWCHHRAIWSPHGAAANGIN